MKRKGSDFRFKKKSTNFARRPERDPEPPRDAEHLEAAHFAACVSTTCAASEQVREGIVEFFWGGAEG